MNSQNEVKTNVSLASDGLGITLEAMFRGMEGLIQAKTVVGDPIEMGDIKLIPLLEITAGMAEGSFAGEAKKRGAGAMTAKMSPIAMLMVQGDKVRLINIKNQDALTKLLDMIPEAVDKVTGKRITGPNVEKAKELAEKIGIRFENDTVQTPEKE